MNRGTLFIISGPSGSGKDTVLGEVFKRFPNLKFSISTITRPMREGETPDGKYRFVTVDEFNSMLEQDMLLEHNEFVGNYYGTPKDYVISNLNNGYDVIVEVDVNGAKQIREKMPEAVSMFVCPPSLEVLKKRLSARGTESPQVLKERLDAAIGEIKRAPEYDYIIINDKLENAVEDAAKVINIGRLKALRNIDLINSIVNGK